MNRYLSTILFFIVLVVGSIMTLLVVDSERKAAKASFDVNADEIVDRVETRLQQHMALITATGAFLEATGAASTRDEFATFIRGLDLETDFEGIRGIGFASLIDVAEEGKVPGTLRDNYGIDRQAWPETGQAKRAPIVLLEPRDTRNEAALGYDMFSEVTRRQAMLKAIEDGGIHATAPVELVQEITDRKQIGFLIYYPVRGEAHPGGVSRNADSLGLPGFAYAPFRSGDFFRAVLDRLPKALIELEVRDATDGKDELLFQTDGYAAARERNGLGNTRHILVAGRDWVLTLRPGPAYVEVSDYVYSLLVGSITLLLAISMAMAMRWQVRAVEAMTALNAVSEKTIKEKDLMLQEMKHRIKNSIARILAMARQTAVHSDSLETFKTSFFARLQAMANAQEMLTRSHWQKADLRDLLDAELKQVFGEGQDAVRLTGPDVQLNESATQALGLTFHELATNALKYGEYDGGNSRLDIRWDCVPKSDCDHLVLDWVETSKIDVQNAKSTGFGTRLIDASIRLELGGTIDRKITPDGISIRIDIPLKDAR